MVIDMASTASNPSLLRSEIFCGFHKQAFLCSYFIWQLEDINTKCWLDRGGRVWAARCNQAYRTNVSLRGQRTLPRNLHFGPLNCSFFIIIWTHINSPKLLETLQLETLITRLLWGNSPWPFSRLFDADVSTLQTQNEKTVSESIIIMEVWGELKFEASKSFGMS